jgi:molybdate transport system regulatory protein
MQKEDALKLRSALGHDAGDKRIEILRRVGEGGSISQAARLAGVSYKAAWQAIDTLGNLAGVQLVESVVGGAGGGGAALTEAGRQLLAVARDLDDARARVLARIPQQAGGALPMAGLAALGLRTSMRNQLPCTVRSLEKEQGAVLVRLALADGTLLNSRITRESVQLLALRAGQPVLALCKATAVRVAAVARAAPGRNLLRGQTTRASRGETGGEVALELTGGLQLVGFAPAGHGLTPKSAAVAIVDDAAVVVAVTG